MASNPGIGKLLIGLIFPVGLTMVIVNGAELFTGNAAVLATSVFEKKASWSQVRPSSCMLLWFAMMQHAFVELQVTAVGMRASSLRMIHAST